MKTKAIILSVALLLLIVGAVSATDISADMASTSATDDVADDLLRLDTPTASVEGAGSTTIDVQDSATYKEKNKEIIKDEKNTKKESQLANVGDFELLNNTLTSDSFDDVMINITQNITLAGSITLNSGIKTLTINGNDFTINGDNQYRFLYIPSSMNVTINDIIITNCSAEMAGAIENYGYLTIMNANFINNTATGTAGGNLGGGAIYNDRRDLTIYNSYFTQNHATDYGGAIFNNAYGDVIINNTNFMQNNATRGGAIFNYLGDVFSYNSNFTQNNATQGGAIYNDWANAKCINSTFDMNSPANYEIDDENHIQFINTDDFIPWGLTCAIYLDDLDECVHSGSSNDYVVPKGHVIRLVVNDGTSSSFVNNTFVLYSYDSVVTNYTELVNAVNDAKESSKEEYYIYMCPGDYNSTGAISWNKTIGITRELCIHGNGVTLDGLNTDERFISVENGCSLVLENITLTHYTSDYGGAIQNRGNITIIDSNFKKNNATHEGGAIINEGNVTLYNTNFMQNNATRGGAIRNNGGIVNSTNSTFDMNSPANYEINDENHIQFINTDDFIPWGLTCAIYLDDMDECVHSGSLNDYVVPKGHVIRLVVNDGTSSSFVNNTFVLYSYDGVVTNYTELVNAVNDAKESSKEEYYIYMCPGDYNSTGAISWNKTIGITRELCIHGNGVTLDGSNTDERFISVENGCSLVLENITLTHYTSDYGGAIKNLGNLTIRDSNFMRNYATQEGGAIVNEGNLTLCNTNFTQNNATRGGAIGNNGGMVNTTNSTFYMNTPQNYIITKNNGQYTLKLVESDDFIDMGTVRIYLDDETTPIYSGNNLECSLPQGIYTIKLVVNGKDQKKFNMNTFIIDSPIEGDNLIVTGYPALVKAVEYAKTSSYDNVTINLMKGNYTATADMTWMDATGSTRKLIINGNEFVLDGINRYQFMQIGTGYNLTLNNITLTQYTATTGGAINNKGNITINNTCLTHNYATSMGGAIENSGSAMINNTNITDNIAGRWIYIEGKIQFRSGNGGAIDNGGGNVTINNSYITHNSACNGGAIESTGNVTINNTNLTHNYGLYNGGAIDNKGNIMINNTNLSYNNGGLIIETPSMVTTTICYGGAICNGGNGTVIITDSNLTHNNITGAGGAIFNGYNGTVNITDSNLTHNNASSGGAISNEDSATVIIRDSKFTLNNATYGGAIYNIGDKATVTIYNSHIAQNNAENNGGAIYNSADYYRGYSIVTIYNTNLTDNTAGFMFTFLGSTYYGTGNGGAIYNAGYNSTVTIYNANLTHNTAGFIYIHLGLTDYETGNGGAIYNTGGNFTLYDANIAYNDANKDGGAIYNTGGNFTLYDANIAYNDANKDGGAIYNKGNGILNVTDSNLTHNNANNNGSAIYNLYGDATIYNNTFTNNLAKSTIGKRAIIDDGRDTIIGNNTNADSSKHNSTIYTNNYYYELIDYEEFEEIEEIYYVNITNNTFEDQPYNTTITISTNNTTTPTVTDIINITFELKDDFGYTLAYKTITVTINQNETTLTTDSTGIASMEYKLISNETVINTTYPGKEGDYNATNTILTLLAEKMETKLLVDDVSTKVGKAFTIKGTLLDINDKPLVSALVNITVNGTKTNATTNEKGQFNTTMTLQEMGEYQVNVTFYENSGYKESNSNTALVTASKTDTQLTLNVSNTTPVNNTSITITVNLTDDTGEPLDNQVVNITIGEETFTMTTTNGIASRQYTVNKLGTQTITASYYGNNMYNANSTTTQINVYKIDTKLTVNVSNITPINSTAIIIAATLTDTNGNKLANQNILLTVGDKTFTVKTNNKGVATQTYTPIKVEKQTITATYDGDSKYTNSTATTSITVKKINTKLTLIVSNTTPVNNTSITITATLTDGNNNKLPNQNITLNINGKTVTTKTNSNGTVTRTYTPTTLGTQNITVTYKGDSKYINSTKTTKITVRNKYSTKTVINKTSGIIGEKLVLKVSVTDQNNKMVTGGNVIFKVNGVTIKDNGKLSGTSNPLKVKVTNGVATATITPDVTMKNAKTITAQYIGTSIYNASTSSTNIIISPRNATIEITTNVKTIKQGQVLTITAKVYDTTNGKKSTNLTKFDGEYIYFKVNGITLKDANGDTLKVKLVNGIATVNYTVPLGIAAITDCKTMTPKNHTIIAGYYNNNYNTNSTTATFQVERSNITLIISNATVNNKTHKLSIKVTVKDYLGNIVAGPNKFIIKVNGLSITNGTQPVYFYSVDGILNINNITIPAYNKYNSLELVTQDRLAYTSQRNATMKIKVLN